MTDKQFHDEMTYQIILFYAEDLLNRGLLPEEAFTQFREDMLQHYTPIISRLSG